MSRCILCGRCVRICSVSPGMRGASLQSSAVSGSMVGTDGGRPLDCDFCVYASPPCPSGQSTTSSTRTARAAGTWHEVVPCAHCGLGCWTGSNNQSEKGSLRRVASPAGEYGKWGSLSSGRFGWRSYRSPARFPFRKSGWTGNCGNRMEARPSAQRRVD
jgi:NADH dehydrogenase/NADH:ubiquinone oxidoreductase subunit G